MQTFIYRARFEPGSKRGVIVTFPDVPEAITQGRNEMDARAQAEEALGLALLSYPQRGLPLPKPKAKSGVPIAVEAEIAAKLAVIEAVREAGINKSELARRLRKDEKEVRRILDPRHSTKLSTLSETLRALDRRLVVAMETIA
jgi:antitoxin HicB